MGKRTLSTLALITYLPLASTANVLTEDVVALRPPAPLVKADARNSQVINDAQLELMTTTREKAPEDLMYPTPTEEELQTLRKKPGSIPWVTWLLCLVEFAERASYYGAKQVFMFFLANELPPGKDFVSFIRNTINMEYRQQNWRPAPYCR
jgi:hypothetical protein